MSDGDTKPEWDGKTLADGIGMGCFSVLCQFRRVFRLLAFADLCFYRRRFTQGNEVRSEGALSRRGLKQIKLAYNPCRPGGRLKLTASALRVKLHLRDGRTDERTNGQTPGIEFGAF